MSKRDFVSALLQQAGSREFPPFLLVLRDGTTRVISGPNPMAVGGNLEAKCEPRFTVRIRTARGEDALQSLDLLRVGEAYVDQDLDIDGDFLAVLDMRRFLSDSHPWLWLQRFVRAFLQGKINSDKREITKHYDFGNDLYFSFLDRSARMYSQALYKSDQDTLEDAVSNKLEYIVRACQLSSSSRVLDVGAGWGSFSSYAAKAGMNVTMLTIAREQYAYLQELCASHAYRGKLSLIYQSIFEFTSSEPFDSAVLLGVTEHLPDYSELIRKLQELVKPGGRVYLDFVAFRKKYAISSFTLRHVFPGRGSPVVLADLLRAVHRSAFEIVALHNDRHSYFLTFRDWARNLEAADMSLIQRYGERSYRLFRLYLWATAHCLCREGQLESYRIVLQHSLGLPSTHVGLAAP